MDQEEPKVKHNYCVNDLVTVILLYCIGLMGSIGAFNEGIRQVR
ncbi:hypothetical protein DSUL_20434 [Desulfovibrionales bacterium]